MAGSIHLDRAQGCLLGMAVGDALGAPLEGLDYQEIRAHYSLVIDYVDGSKAWKKKPLRWRLPGLYSDDTQQALVLAEVLIERGRIEPERIAELFLELASAQGSYLGAHRGVGRSFRQVINDLQRGMSPRETGQFSAGIGAAMRIAPVALYYAEDPQRLREEVIQASLLTHRDCRSLAGALAVSHAIARLLCGDRKEPSFLFRLAADVARSERWIAEHHSDQVVSLRRHVHSLSRAIARVESSVDASRERALTALVDEANLHGPDHLCRRPTMGFSPACVPTCLYFFLTTDSFEDALIEIVNQGGDADSAGAILGALAGAHYGVGQIPGYWLNGLENRDGIALRALALARRSAEGLDIPDLIETERRLTEREDAHRGDMTPPRCA